MSIAEKIIKEIPNADVSKLSENQLLSIHDALYGTHDIAIKPKKEVVKTPRKKRKVDFSRNRVRLILPEHEAYLKKVIKHLNKYDVIVEVIKTGISVKVANSDGYTVNLLNYLELRLLNGKLCGNLYLNRIKTDEHISNLTNVGLYRRVKGTYTMDKVFEGEVIQFTGKENMKYLVELCQEVLMLKKKRNRKNQRTK